MEKIGRNEPCWCGSGRKYKQCHEAFDEKIKHFELQGHMVPERCMIKNPEQLAGIRESGLVNIAVLDYVAENIREGLTVRWRGKQGSWAAFRRLWAMKDILKAYVPL